MLTIQLSDEQEAKMNEFIKKHNKKCKLMKNKENQVHVHVADGQIIL